MDEGTYTVDIQVTGDTPATVAPSAAIHMTNFQTTATFSATVVNGIMAKGVSSVSGNATTINVISTNSINATTATVNAAATSGADFTIPTETLVANTPLTVSLPTSPITIGTWTATASASSMSFIAGEVDITLSLDVGFSVPATMVCTAPATPVVIAETTVN
jgi:hypothetical protein